MTQFKGRKQAILDMFGEAILNRVNNGIAYSGQTPEDFWEELSSVENLCRKAGTYLETGKYNEAGWGFPEEEYEDSERAEYERLKQKFDG